MPRDPTNSRDARRSLLNPGESSLPRARRPKKAPIVAPKMKLFSLVVKANAIAATISHSQRGPRVSR